MTPAFHRGSGNSAVAPAILTVGPAIFNRGTGIYDSGAWFAELSATCSIAQVYQLKRSSLIGMNLVRRGIELTIN